MVLATRISAPNTSLAVIRPKPQPDSPTASEISVIMLKSELPHEAPNPVSKKKAPSVHHVDRRRGGVAARGAGAAMARGSTGNAMKGITEWLASIGLSEYAQRFADNAIDLSVIRDLTEQDLKDLGVLLGHRRKILRAITELPAAPGPTETATELVARDEAERRHLTVM